MEVCLIVCVTFGQPIVPEDIERLPSQVVCRDQAVLACEWVDELLDVRERFPSRAHLYETELTRAMKVRLFWQTACNAHYHHSNSSHKFLLPQLSALAASVGEEHWFLCEWPWVGMPPPVVERSHRGRAAEKREYPQVCPAPSR
jgi:hypothetical protein